MAEEGVIDEGAGHEQETVIVERRRRHPLRTAAKWIGIVLLILVFLAAAFLAWLNTDAGRRFVVRQINQLEFASGLDIDIGRIEGSLFGGLTLHDLTLKDPRGTFFRAPRAELDYRPLSYFQNHVDIRSLVIPQARLWRLPELRSTGDPNAPMLPDLEIDIGRLQVQRMMIDPAVTGQRHLMSIDGRARIAEGRAQIASNIATVRAPGLAGGDRIMLRLDAVPDSNRLAMGLRVEAPADGFVAGMTGIRQPLLASVQGSGSWAQWQGRALATIGGQGFANISIGARDGTFTILGPVNAALVAPEAARRILSPLVQVNLVTSLDQRRADLRLRLNSESVAVAAEGLVDLGQSQYRDLRVAARLIRPGAIAPQLRGRDLRVAMVLNGAFARPFVAYNLTAAQIGFGEYTIDDLRATGRAQMRSDRIVVPVVARAARIRGVPEQFGGLLTNVGLNGDLAISGGQIVSDNLRIRSDRLNATAVLAFDMGRGMYRVGLQGRVNNFQIDGVGLVDITTTMDVVSRANGFGLRGRFVAQTRRLDNESVRDFLGGRATVSADVLMNPDGVIRLNGIRVTAPLLRITSGSGTYSPNGRIDFRLAGVSSAYGPLAVHITGTPTAPQVRLRAQNLGFGIGLRDVEAEIRATARGYEIRARGQSQYGPFEADVLVLTGRGPLTLEIRRLLFAGITFRGRVVQTPAGPFVGTLTMAGQGLDGTIRLGAAGRYQSAQIVATANAAQVPGPVPIQIQRGLINAGIILYPDAPQVVGDVQVAGLRSGSLLVDRGRARIDYRGGRGTAQVFAEGRSGVPFRIAANTLLTPTHIRAALAGAVNNIPFRFAQPADIRHAGGDWMLEPVRVILSQGQMRLAGRYGSRGVVVQSRLDGIDLAVLNVVSPDLGIGGRATGSLDFFMPAGGAFPRAETRLNIENFTRTGIATRSEAINLAIAGSLTEQGGLLNAAIRRRGALIGRAQARMQPVGGGGSWTERLMASPLAGGIRFNGPADALFSLAGLAGHQLTGPLAVGVDFSGRVQSPQFVGVLRANNLTYLNEQYGTRITNLAVTGRFTASELQIVQMNGRAGAGTVTGTGTVGLAAAAGFPMDVRLNFQNAQLARSDDIGATVTGEVAITSGRGRRALVSGDLELPEVRYQIVRQGASEIPQLAGVRRRGEPIRTASPAEEETGVPSVWNLDLRVRADNRVYVSGMGMESEWQTDLRVGGTSSTPSITGQVELIRGTLSLAGRRFNLTRGNVQFTGARPPNPRIDLVAETEVEGVTIAVNVGGNAYNPQIAFSSNPGLPQDEIVARILFGSSVTEISALQAVQVAASLNSLRGGGGGGLNPLGALRSATGIDRLRILGADQTTGRGTAIAAGMYLSDDIYIEIVTDARGFTATQLEIALSRTLSVLSQFGGTSGTNVNVRYSRDY
jgi:translocation and assembly module TamB